jgi:fructose-specific phosphotransferase system component IIB
VKIIKAFIKKPIIFIMILILFFVPTGLARPPEGVDLLHIVSIGVDRIGEELEVSTLAYVITPTERYDENFFLLSAKAPSITEALDLISINVGKKLITLHIGVVIINQELAEKSVIDTFNYFFRSNSITNDTFLLCTTSSAKEILMSEQSLIQASGINLKEIALFYENYMSLFEINIESFYRGYFSPTKSSIISLIGLVGEDEAKQTTSSEQQSVSAIQKGESGGAQSSSSGGSKNSGLQSLGSESASESGGSAESGGPKYIQSTGKAIIFYDGSLKTILSEEELRGLNWIGTNTKNTNLHVENITDENYENAEIYFSVEGNEVKINSYFVNEKPVMEITIKLYIKAEQIIQPDLASKKDNIASDKNYLTETVRNKIENTVKKEFSKGLLKIIENQTDVIDIYKTLSLQNHSKFLKWYESLDESKDFLREIDYRVNVRVKATH